jgi:hypothetical protein
LSDPAGTTLTPALSQGERGKLQADPLSLRERAGVRAQQRQLSSRGTTPDHPVLYTVGRPVTNRDRTWRISEW